MSYLQTSGVSAAADLENNLFVQDTVRPEAEWRHDKEECGLRCQAKLGPDLVLELGVGVTLFPHLSNGCERYSCCTQDQAKPNPSMDGEWLSRPHP